MVIKQIQNSTGHKKMMPEMQVQLECALLASNPLITYSESLVISTIGAKDVGPVQNHYKRMLAYMPNQIKWPAMATTSYQQSAKVTQSPYIDAELPRIH
jgi:hypothetical protein